MKEFLIVVLFGLMCFVAGIMAAVVKYQHDFEIIKESCIPYTCTTDTECEEEERKRRMNYI